MHRIIKTMLRNKKKAVGHERTAVDCHPGLRIAMVMRSGSRKGGGVYDAARGLARELRQQNCARAEVFVANDEYLPSDRVAWGETCLRSFPTWGPAAFGYTIGMSESLVGYSPDVVHLHGLWGHFSLVARRVSQQRKAKLIISTHGMLLPWAMTHHAVRKNAALLLYEQKTLKKADCIHVTSKAELESLREFGLRQPIAVIPWGVDVLPLEGGSIRTKPRTLLSLGRLHPIKGLDRLIQAWAKLESKHLDWQLRIVGPSEGGYRQTLLDLCQQAGCSRVIFDEYVTGSEKQAIFEAADLFILPSLSENFALTVVEALMHGLPVVASTAAPWGEIAGVGCGWSVVPEVEMIRGTLDEAMSLPREVLDKMGRRGRAWVEEEFTWERCADRTSAMYEWLVGHRSMPDFIFPHA